MSAQKQVDNSPHASPTKKNSRDAVILAGLSGGGARAVDLDGAMVERLMALTEEQIDMLPPDRAEHLRSVRETLRKAAPGSSGLVRRNLTSDESPTATAAADEAGGCPSATLRVFVEALNRRVPPGAADPIHKPGLWHLLLGSVVTALTACAPEPKCRNPSASEVVEAMSAYTPYRKGKNPSLSATDRGAWITREHQVVSLSRDSTSVEFPRRSLSLATIMRGDESVFRLVQKRVDLLALAAPTLSFPHRPD